MADGYTRAIKATAAFADITSGRVPASDGDGAFSDATTVNVPDSTNARYMSDAQESGLDALIAATPVYLSAADKYKQEIITFLGEDGADLSFDFDDFTVSVPLGMVPWGWENGGAVVSSTNPSCLECSPAAGATEYALRSPRFFLTTPGSLKWAVWARVILGTAYNAASEGVVYVIESPDSAQLLAGANGPVSTTHFSLRVNALGSPAPSITSTISLDTGVAHIVRFGSKGDGNIYLKVDDEAWQSGAFGGNWTGYTRLGIKGCANTAARKIDCDWVMSAALRIG